MSGNPSPSPTSPSASTQANASGARTQIIATVVAVLLLVLAGLTLYFILRWRGRQGGHDVESPSTRSKAVDRSHIAAQITPYGSASNLTPQFNHTPGSDMRIAIRRPDGAWEFAHPGSPFNPAGVREIEVPPPSAGTMSSFPPTPVTPEMPKSPAEMMKERESNAARLIRKGYDYREFDVDTPPPAYGQAPGYLDHTKDNSPQTMTAT
ncbi:hypothetical protein AX17_006114 [Amanita inopinata Kibby_2008]|nr:hypothetical protein AX17_006114 [Amanita inopinata Kibby_2008]